MLAALKKRKGNSATPKAAPKAALLDARDFLAPFAHINQHTIVTKDGGVMQTIRITENKNGLDYEPHDAGGNLRDCIRKAFMHHVASDNVSLWIHTLRKRRGVSFAANYDHSFAAHVNNRWRAENGWSHQYYNEVYITLVYDGQTSAMWDKALMKEGALPKKNRMMRNIYVEAAAGELDIMIGSMIDELQQYYKVHRLGIVERMPNGDKHLPQAPIFFSEPMEFFSYLLNLRAEEVPLPDSDISAALQSCALVFGFNAMEAKNDEGAKRFAALLSLKQYREIPSQTVDMLLQAPMELVVSQAFHFVPEEAALKEYRTQKEFFEMSGDDYSMRASGLAEMIQANRKSVTDFGTQQTSIMVLVDELKKLDDDIAKLQKAFSGIGLACVREDVRLEEIFWSMFPGNFAFLRRNTYIPTQRIAGFSKLNRFASGAGVGNFWREPVSLVPTLVNSPYFFNFHVQDNGHTAWVDFNSFGDRMADQSLAFLITQAEKLHPRVYYFDHHESARLWFNKMGARYKKLRAHARERTFALNPFSLERNPRNNAFLTAWCSELVGATDEERAQLKAIVDAGASDSLDHFVSALKTAAPLLAARFAPWVGSGQYAGFFAATSDEFAQESDWLGIDLSEAFATPQSAVAAFAYLLHRVILALDGRPTIIVLNHALPILQQPFFASRLESLLEMLKENNVAMVMRLRYSDMLRESEVASSIFKNAATTVIVPDDLQLAYASLLPNVLSGGDQDLLCDMERMRGDILVKQGEETVAIRINLDHMPDVSAIFHNDIKTLSSAGGPFSSLPPEEVL